MDRQIAQLSGIKMGTYFRNSAKINCFTNDGSSTQYLAGTQVSYTCTHMYTHEDIAISHLNFRVAMFLEMIGFASTALQMFLDVGISLKK